MSNFTGRPSDEQPFTLFWWIELRDRYTYLYDRDIEKYNLRSRWMERINFVNRKLEQYE